MHWDSLAKNPNTKREWDHDLSNTARQEYGICTIGFSQNLGWEIGLWEQSLPPPP